MPVIACNSGGPKESVENGRTGFLCEPKANEWCEQMMKLFRGARLAEKMGEDGRERVVRLFSFKAF